jgi:hypothetical protein
MTLWTRQITDTATNMHLQIPNEPAIGTPTWRPTEVRAEPVALTVAMIGAVVPSL